MNVPGSNLPPSPPHSVARSSTGMYSITSSGGRKYSMQAMEVELQEHHRALRDFLNQSIREDRAYQPHNRARDKLLRLSAIQFQELSTDVYDELQRREDDRAAHNAGQLDKSAPRFLLPKQNFHPKRNQARQKLSTLASKKFRELATDVLFELERRVPRFANNSIDRVAPSSPTHSEASLRDRRPGAPRSRHGPGMSVGIPPPFDGKQPNGTSPTGPYSPGAYSSGSRSIRSGEFGRPLQKQFQSNTMVPNKSRMVEEDDDHSEDGDTFDVNGTTTPPQRTSRRLTGGSGTFRLRDSTYNKEYETKISGLETKVSMLEEQLRDKDDEVRAAQAVAAEKAEMVETEQAKSSDLLSDLERQVQSAETLNQNLNQEVERLKTANSELEERLQDHDALRDNHEELRSAHSQLQERLGEHDALRDDHEELRSAYSQLQERLGEHEALQDDFEELRGVHGELQERLGEHENLRQEHEGLQQDFEGLRTTHSQLQEDHARMLEVQQQRDDSGDWKSRYEELEKRLQNQTHITNQVREESAQTLQELSMLSTQHDQSEDEKDKLLSRIAQLENAIDDWKHRYSKSKIQRRSLKATSMALSADQPDATRTTTTFMDPHGLVEDIHVTHYQTSINELLHLARSPDHPAVFHYMRTLVGAVKTLVDDVDTPSSTSSPSSASAPAAIPEDVARTRGRLKKHVSRAANSLTTTAKTYASSDGLTPVSLVDAAASNLTAAVIELLREVKIRPSVGADPVDVEGDRSPGRANGDVLDGES